jgi:hypothetical protein
VGCLARRGEEMDGILRGRGYEYLGISKHTAQTRWGTLYAMGGDAGGIDIGYWTAAAWNVYILRF